MKFLEFPFVKSLPIFIPICAVCSSVIAGSPQNFELGTLDSSITINLDLPFSWKILFAAALSSFILQIVVLIRCPSFIRKYPDFRRFSDFGGGSLDLVEALDDDSADILFGVDRNRLNEYINDFRDPDTPEPELMVMKGLYRGFVDDSAPQQEAYGFMIEWLEYARKKSIYICLFLMIFISSCSFFVIGQNILSVLVFIFK